MIILALCLPLPCIAAAQECEFPKGTVKQTPPPNAATVAAYQWDTGYDKEVDGEYMQTLRILYKNGDHAVIQHKYCTLYRFEINYFRNRQADNLDAKAISTLVAGLYTQYFSAPQKVKFSRPLAQIIAATFKEQNFDREKDFGYGLPLEEAIYPDSDLSLTYLINYKSLDDMTSGIYSSVTSFALGLGGGGGD